TAPADAESDTVQVAAFLVRQAARRSSSWRAERSLAEELEVAGVPGVEGLDTRRLVRHLRQRGAMRGALSNEVTDPGRLGELALAAPAPVPRRGPRPPPPHKSPPPRVGCPTPPWPPPPPTPGPWAPGGPGPSR